MSENEHNQHYPDKQVRNTVHQNERPYWKRIHHSLFFWFFLFLMYIGIMYYIVSFNFAFAPHGQIKQPSRNSITR